MRSAAYGRNAHQLGHATDFLALEGAIEPAWKLTHLLNANELLVVDGNEVIFEYANPVGVHHSGSRSLRIIIIRSQTHLGCIAAPWLLRVIVYPRDVVSKTLLVVRLAGASQVQVTLGILRFLNRSGLTHAL